MLYLYIFALSLLAILTGVIIGASIFFWEVFRRRDWKEAAMMATWQLPPYMGYNEDGLPISWWFNSRTKNPSHYTNLFKKNRLGVAWYKYWYSKYGEWMPVKLVRET